MRIYFVKLPSFLRALLLKLRKDYNNKGMNKRGTVSNTSD
jgi:hypothetical protein